METVSNPFQACNDIFFKPNRVFATLAHKHNWSWLAFFIVAAMALLPSYMYFNFVDFDWYKNMVVDTMYGDLSPAEQNMYRSNMTADSTVMFTLIGGILVLTIINAVMATYLNLVTKSDEENVNGFTDWYGFTWWVGLPIVVNTLLALGLILMSSDHQVSPAIMAPTSLAFIFNVEMSSDWFNLLTAIRLDVLWSIYLIAVGVAQWTSFSGRKPYVIAAAPYLIIWTVWIVAILLG